MGCVAGIDEEECGGNGDAGFGGAGDTSAPDNNPLLLKDGCDQVHRQQQLPSLKKIDWEHNL